MLSGKATKCIVLVVLFVATFFFSMIPLRITSMLKRETSLSKRRKFQTALSLLSCYAAGVFLATCLLDLFPDVQEKFSDLFSRTNILTSYPVAEFTMTLGLFIILFIEQFVLNCRGDEDEMGLSDPLLSEEEYSGPIMSPEDYESSIQSTSVNNLNTPQPTLDESRDTDYNDYEYPVPVRYENPRYAEEDHPTVISEDAKSVDYHDPNSHSNIRAFILLAALSLHSVFEGLAVGLQGSSSQVLQIFAALALHKSILAFSLGMNLGQSRLSFWAVVRSNLLFSITSPLGIGIGIAIDDLTAKDSIPALVIDGLLQGLACGTFLYIVFFEVLPHELNSNKTYPNRLLKVLALILGYATVATLLFLAPSVVRPNCQGNPTPIGG